MLYWIVQSTVISIVLILLVHHLFNFFRATLTVPKIKDLVNTSTQKYDNMFHIISKGNNNESDINVSDHYGYTTQDLLPKPETDMKSELKNFLKKQLNDSSSTPISALDSMTPNSYSEYNAS